MTIRTTALTVLAVAATVGFAVVATPQPAEARHAHHHHHRHFGVFIGAGVGAYAYYEADPAYYDGCIWTRQQVWDGWAWRLRRVQICN
jgi:hypothetical protein